jgi:Fe/S biogenesis protein NfuA
MLTFTDLAKERVLRFLDAQKSQGVSALRIAGSRAEPKLWLVRGDDRQEGDRVFDGGGFDVYLDPMSAQQLEGAKVDFVDDVMQSGFRVYFESPSWDDPVAQRVQDVLDTMINPGVAGHGGTVSLKGVQDGKAIIEFGGGCQGCGAADVTLKHGVERMVREQVPEIVAIVDATDHAAGENPYYDPDVVRGDEESPLGR